MPFYKTARENIYKTLVVFVCEIFSEYMFYLQLLNINSCELLSLNKNKNFPPMTKQHNITNISAISSLRLSNADLTMQWLPIVTNCITKRPLSYDKFNH